MNKNAATSLRKYRAQRCFDGYLSLPPSLRSSARTAPLVEAMFEYAYDHIPRDQVMSSGQVSASWEDTQRISQRLEEFLPRSRAQFNEPLMNWLHENLVPEAWTYPEDMRRLVSDLLED